MPEPDLGRELAKPDPGVRPPARHAGVLINHQHRPRGPTKLDRALRQRILPRRRFEMALDLPGRGLPHVDHSATLAMAVGDLREPHSSRASSTIAASRRASITVTVVRTSGGSVSHTAAGTTRSSPNTSVN